MAGGHCGSGDGKMRASGGNVGHKGDGRGGGNEISTSLSVPRQSVGVRSSAEFFELVHEASRHAHP